MEWLNLNPHLLVLLLQLMVSNLEAFLTLWPSLTMSSQELMDWAAGHNFFSFVLRSDQPGMESSIIYRLMRKCVHLHLLTIGYAPAFAKCRNVFNFSPPGNLFLALSSKPFYPSLENGSHPLSLSTIAQILSPTTSTLLPAK